MTVKKPATVSTDISPRLKRRKIRRQIRGMQIVEKVPAAAHLNRCKIHRFQKSVIMNRLIRV
jgi:hypothetical protein